jgi:Kef-type K+ transport system membrane component KefB
LKNGSFVVLKGFDLTPFLQLSLALAILITAAKFGGYLSFRLGQPSVLGELLVGILLGPTVIDLLHLSYFTDTHLAEVIHQLAEIGVMLLMFLAGLELHLTDLLKSGKVAAFAGTLGVVLPLGLGIGLGLSFSMEMPVAIFIGLILSATSVSISAQTLMELKVLRSRVGLSLLGAAVFDDVLVVLGLSIFTALQNTGTESSGLAGVLSLVLRMILYLGIATGMGMLILPRLSRKIHSLPISHGLLAFTVVLLLLYGWAAEEWGGMAAITGAFLAGLVLSQSQVKERIENGISALAYGLFVPVFFINVGLTANIRQISPSAFWFFLWMTLIAITSKVLGSGLGANLSGLSRLESIQLGIGMVSRGEVGLIVASVGIAQGLITQETFASIVGVIIITTLLTPPLLRAAFRHPKTKAPPPDLTASTEANTSNKGETS